MPHNILFNHHMPSYLSKLSVLILVALLSACASNPHSGEDEQNPQTYSDPLQGFNRAMFGFNDALDIFILKPVAQGYDYAVPGLVKTGVNNFFDNLGEIRNIANDIFQWKWKQAGNDTGRFLVNSTVGVLGLFDFATQSGLVENEGEDFGQSMATWGVPQGPYLVLPFWGPTTVRNLAGLPVDWRLSPLRYVNDDRTRLRLYMLRVVDTRMELLDAEDLVSGDRYLFIRDAYLQKREYLIKDGVVEDDFGDDFDDFDAWEDESF